MSADVIGFAHFAVHDHAANSFAMICYLQPIAYIQSLPIDGQRLMRQAIENHQRNQLFGKLIGSIIIRAIGSRYCHSSPKMARKGVLLPISPDQLSNGFFFIADCQGNAILTAITEEIFNTGRFIVSR